MGSWLAFRGSLAALAGQARAQPLGLAFLYLAHALPYLWVIWVIDPEYPSRPLGAQLWVALNGLLAPTLLILLMHGTGRFLRYPLVIAHHLLVLGAYLLFTLYYSYFQMPPSLYAAFQADQAPYIFQQVVLQLMGPMEWLSLALLCMSALVAIRWGRAIARPYPLAALALVLLVFVFYNMTKKTMLEVARATGEREDFRIFRFIPYVRESLREQLPFYLDKRLPAAVAWPGKVNPAGEGGPRQEGLRNVLILQVESLDKWVIDHSVDGREVMPNLRRLKAESLYFDNFYAQRGGGGSSDAELAALTSLLPQEYAALRSPTLRFVPSLARVLASHGYHAIGMHGFTGKFWYRTDAYRNLGFHRFADQKSYAGEAQGWHSKDLPFLEQSLAMLKALPKPFFAYLITMQSHGPYRNYSEATLPFQPGRPDLLEHYLRSMHEVDAAIGVFWEGLRASGLLEDTIVLLYADHDSGAKETGCLHKCVPLLMQAPGVQAGVNPTLGSHLDIAPTVFALLGLAEPSDAWLGASLLSPGPREIPFPDGKSLRLSAAGALTLAKDPSHQKYRDYSDWRLIGVAE